MSVTTANARVETSSYLHIQIPPGKSPFQLLGGLGTVLTMMMMIMIVGYSLSAIPVGITTCLAVCEYFNTWLNAMSSSVDGDDDDDFPFPFNSKIVYYVFEDNDDDDDNDYSPF